MAPSSSSAWSNLSNFNIHTLEAQLLLVETGAASMAEYFASQQKMHNVEVAKLKHLIKTLISAQISSQQDLHLSSPTIAAVASSDSVSSSTPRVCARAAFASSDSTQPPAPRVCNRAGCNQHIPSSDPTRDRYLQGKLVVTS